MASALIVPGVQVKTQFEPAPVLAGATGILGLVGVTDRGPLEPTPVGTFGEFLSLFGVASRYSLPEAHTAFTNGVMEIVVARTEPRSAKASLRLRDDDNEEVAILESRAEGAWGNRLAARVTQVRTLDQSGIKYVNLDILLDGERIESLNNLVMDENNPNYLFAQINAQSRVVVAYDPLFEKALPPTLAKTPLIAAPAAKATATLAGVGGAAVTVTAKQAGGAGNLIAVRVKPGGPPGSVTIDVIREGGDTVSHADLDTVAAISGISNPLVSFVATALPNPVAGVPLTGGRTKGNVLPLPPAPDKPLLELVATPDAPASAAVELAAGSAGRATLLVYADAADADPAETFADVTMDPDDPNYLPALLADSGLIRALDLFERRTATSLPREALKPQKFTGGVSPGVADYQDALDRLEGAEQVDMVIASVANQLDGADVRRVHQAVNAHCLKMADPARNRIGLGSVTAAATAKRETRVGAILDHADDVRSDAFILAAPAGSEAAVAGLLSLQDYFQSPTFKTVAALGVPPGDYSDAELNQLVAGNVLVVNKKRKRGTIVVKGVLTSGRQINVQRTANKAVRDVKAIADVYIGLLNNEGNRNALRQQIIALFLQMTRDGALVPSTDGTSPPYAVDVYSTQADFANGIVRIDVAVRPVRAIDYVYATILVQN
jgi:hypothetical protein